MRLVKQHGFQKGLWSLGIQHPERVHCPQAAPRPGPTPGFELLAEWAAEYVLTPGRVLLAGPLSWSLRAGEVARPAGEPSAE